MALPAVKPIGGFISLFWVVNSKYLINKAFYQKYFCVRTFSRLKSNFVPKGIPIGFQMAEKNANTDTQTNTHFGIYISRDITTIPIIIDT